MYTKKIDQENFVFFVGLWNPSHHRNSKIIELFCSLDNVVIEDLTWSPFKNLLDLNKFNFFRKIKFILLLFLYLLIFFQNVKKMKKGIIFIGYPNFINIHFIFLCRLFKLRVVTDNLILLSETISNDRRITKSKLIIFLADLIQKLCISLSDLNIFDTKENKDFILRKLNKLESKYLIISTAPNNVNEITNRNHKEIDFLWFGYYSNFHGIFGILKWLSQLNHEKLNIWFIGDGTLRNAAVAEAKKSNIKINFLPPLSIDDLRKNIQKSHFCIGVYNNSDKYKRCIPHKIWLSVANCVPSITSYSELLFNTFGNSLLYFDEISEFNSFEQLLNFYQSKFSSSTKLIDKVILQSESDLSDFKIKLTNLFNN